MPPSDHDRHGAAARHGFKFGFGVVALHHVRAELRHDAGGEAEILRIACHRTTHGSHAHDGDAVTGSGIDEVGQILQRLALVSTADEHLHGKHAGIQANGFFDVQRGAFIGERLETWAAKLGLLAVDLAFPFFEGAYHRGATAGTQRDGFRGARWDDAALDATREHEAVRVGFEGHDGLVHALQARGRALEVAVIEGEHDGAPILGIEDLAEAIFETPVILVAALEEESWGGLGHVGEVFLFLLVCCAGGDVGHGDVRFSLRGPRLWARIGTVQAWKQ